MQKLVLDVINGGMSERDRFREAMKEAKMRLLGPAAMFVRSDDLAKVLGRIEKVKAEIGEVSSLGAISYALVFSDWLGAFRIQYAENQQLQQRIEMRLQEIVERAKEKGVEPPENYIGLRLQAFSCLWQMLEEAGGND